MSKFVLEAEKVCKFHTELVNNTPVDMFMGGQITFFKQGYRYDILGDGRYYVNADEQIPTDTKIRYLKGYLGFDRQELTVEEYDKELFTIREGRISDILAHLKQGF